MVRNVINEVFTQRGFHDLHVFDEYLIKVASLFMCDSRIVECRSKFQSLQRFTNSWELLIKVSTNYYLREESICIAYSASSFISSSSSCIARRCSGLLYISLKYSAFASSTRARSSMTSSSPSVPFLSYRTTGLLVLIMRTLLAIF